MSLQWFEWHTAHERMQGRLHALTRGQRYNFRFDPASGTGYTNFGSQTIGVNPLAMDKVFEAEGIKGKARDEANYLMTRALTGHEALHVLYTDPEAIEASKSHKDLKLITNLLEDARIENIGAEESYVSGKLFKLFSAVVMKMMPEFKDSDISDPFTAVQLLQYWREGYAIPEISDDARKTWIKLRNMAEDALYAPTTWDVLKISHKVCELLGIGKHTPPKQPQSDLGKELQDLDDKRSGDMKGQRKQRPKDNPLEDNRPQKGEPEQDDDKAEAPGGGSDDQQPKDDTQGSGSPQQQDDQDDQQPSDKSDDKQGGPGGHEDQPAQDDNDTGEPQEDDPQNQQPDDGPGGGQAPGTDDETGQGQPQYQPQDDPDEDDPGDDPSAGRQDNPDFDLSQVVNDCQNAVKDKLDDDVPQGDVKKLIRGAASYDPSAYNNRDIVGRPYMDIYAIAKPIAKEIIKELKSPNPKAVKGPSEYPGRVRMRYFVRDPEKPFAKKNSSGKSVPKMALSLIIDRSESMSCRAQELKIMAMAVYLACEELDLPLAIWVLEGQIQLKKHDEWGPHILAKIAGLTAITGTNMTPTLSSASDELKKRPEPLEQIVMIHDGGPADKHNVIDWRKKLGRISLYCMLVVPGIKQPDLILQRKHEVMDDLVGAGNYCIAFMEEIPGFWCSFVKLKREALAR